MTRESLLTPNGEEVGARGVHPVAARWRSICWMAGSREDAR